MLRLVCRYYGRADLWDPKEKRQVPVEVKTRNPIIVAFPALSSDADDYIAVYEVVEEEFVSLKSPKRT